MASKERAASIQAAKLAMQSEKLSLRRAAERYDVPKSTLHRHRQTDVRCGAGRPTVLTEEEEKVIVLE